MKNMKAALMLFLLLTAVTGVLHPLAVTGLAQLCFPEKAQGSPVKLNGRPVGSSLLAQKFSSPAYFWPRPSAADFQAVPSGAGNLGPTSLALRQAIADRQKALGPYFSAEIPAELLTASGSGLDPHLSPEAALAQVEHVAEARGLSAAQRAGLEQLLREKIQGPQWLVFGRPRVNVLELNLALDERFGPASAEAKP